MCSKKNIGIRSLKHRKDMYIEWKGAKWKRLRTLDTVHCIMCFTGGVESELEKRERESVYKTRLYKGVQEVKKRKGREILNKRSQQKLYTKGLEERKRRMYVMEYSKVKAIEKTEHLN